MSTKKIWCVSSVSLLMTAQQSHRPPVPVLIIDHKLAFKTQPGEKYNGFVIILNLQWILVCLVMETCNKQQSQWSRHLQGFNAVNKAAQQNTWLTADEHCGDWTSGTRLTKSLGQLVVFNVTLEGQESQVSFTFFPKKWRQTLDRALMFID